MSSWSKYPRACPQVVLALQRLVLALGSDSPNTYSVLLPALQVCQYLLCYHDHIVYDCTIWDNLAWLPLSTPWAYRNPVLQLVTWFAHYSPKAKPLGHWTRFVWS